MDLEGDLHEILTRPRQIRVEWASMLVIKGVEGVGELRLKMDSLLRTIAALDTFDVSNASWRYSPYRLRAASKTDVAEGDDEEEGDLAQRFGKEDEAVAGDEETLEQLMEDAKRAAGEGVEEVVEEDVEWAMRRDVMK